MPWLQLRLDTHPDQVTTLEQLLLASGAAAVTLEDNADQPLLEPGVGETPLWKKIRLTGLFPVDTDMDAVVAAFPLQLKQDSKLRVDILEDKDWEREWMQHYQPMQFGNTLWICPSWLEPPEPNATVISLDPGLAFGTGTHPTTALCLTELASMDLRGINTIDFGCGSGILAIAALKLGANSCLAVDNDPQALAATLDNASRNNITDNQLQVHLPTEFDAKRYHQSANLVIANILAGPLIQLSDTLLNFLAPGGTLLLSGLLNTQAAELRAHYQMQLELDVVGELDDWVCLRGTLPR